MRRRISRFLPADTISRVTSTSEHRQPANSPHDTGASSVTRFGTELVAWVAGPWAVQRTTGSWLLTLATLVFLVGLPALCNTPGDKKVTGIATPGPLRVLIELVLAGAAVVGAWTIWPSWAATMVAVLVVAMAVTGIARYRWLLDGAPPVSDDAN